MQRKPNDHKEAKKKATQTHKTTGKRRETITKGYRAAKIIKDETVTKRRSRKLEAKQYRTAKNDAQ